MSTHFSKSFDAPAKLKRRRRNIAISIASAVLAVGGGAFAAIALSSNETTAALAKGNASALVLDNAEFTRSLFPGSSTGLRFRVTNPNPFDASVSKVVVSGESSTTCNVQQLTGPASTVGQVSGLTLTLAQPVSIPAGQSVNVEYPKVVTLAAAATDSCAISAKFKVTGSGSGNE